MSYSKKIKAVLELTGKDHAGLAKYLGISKQALSNKFYRESFSATDLIKIAEFCGAILSFTTKNGDKLSFEVSDIPSKEDKK